MPNPRPTDVKLVLSTGDAAYSFAAKMYEDGTFAITQAGQSTLGTPKARMLSQLGDVLDDVIAAHSASPVALTPMECSSLIGALTHYYDSSKTGRPEMPVHIRDLICKLAR